MNPVPEIAITSASPIFTEALQHWLEGGGHDFACRALGPAELERDGLRYAPDIVLVAPQDWREMAGVLPRMRHCFSGLPWLLLADMRLAGMFSSLIETEFCTVVPPGASPRELRMALWVLLERKALCPPERLLQLFACGAARARRGAESAPTPKEFQCGCAVSLGLSNRQIAETLYVGQGTVKTHLHHLLRKLQLGDREELVPYFERAFAPLTLTKG